MRRIIGVPARVPEKQHVPKQPLQRQIHRRPPLFRHHPNPRRVANARQLEGAQLAEHPGHDRGDAGGHDQTARTGEGAAGQVHEGGFHVVGRGVFDGVERVDVAGYDEEEGDCCAAADAEAEEGELEEAWAGFGGQRGGVEEWCEGGAEVACYHDEGCDAPEALDSVRIYIYINAFFVGSYIDPIVVSLLQLSHRDVSVFSRTRNERQVPVYLPSYVYICVYQLSSSQENGYYIYRQLLYRVSPIGMHPAQQTEK